MKSVWVAMVLALGNNLARTQAFAQTVGPPLGTVAVEDAGVVTPATAAVVAAGGRVAVNGGSTVTANPGRNADVTLTRGGSVLVCQTSGLHMAGSIPGPLLLALDRGAMEIRMKSTGDDSVMTPDLRFTMAGGGVLDLRLRVSMNGDTCVENRGRKAPTLRLTDAFGDNSYEVKPGQHVLFEHGSLREVVDRETTPCGCPPGETTGVSIAEAMLYGGGKKTAPKDAQAVHPFPAAVSEGLAPPTPVAPEAPAGGTHVQVAAALTYDPTAPKTSGSETAETAATPSAAVQPQPTRKHGPFSAIGRFFKRMFVR